MDSRSKFPDPDIGEKYGLRDLQSGIPERGVNISTWCIKYVNSLHAGNTLVPLIFSEHSILGIILKGAAKLLRNFIKRDKVEMGIWKPAKAQFLEFLAYRGQ